MNEGNFTDPADDTPGPDGPFSDQGSAAPARHAVEQQGTEGGPRLSPAEQLAKIEAEWRASLPEQLRPVAQRYGQQLFLLASFIINGSAGLARLGQVAATTKARFEQLHARQAA